MGAKTDQIIGRGKQDLGAISADKKMNAQFVACASRIKRQVVADSAGLEVGAVALLPCERQPSSISRCAVVGFVLGAPDGALLPHCPARGAEHDNRADHLLLSASGAQVHRDPGFVSAPVSEPVAPDASLARTDEWS